MFAFLLLLFVLLVIYSFTAATKEGFNPMNTSPSHEVNIPVNKIPSMLPSPPASMKISNTVSTSAQNGSIFSNCPVEPSTLPGQLPHAPYQQIAVASPLPYEDTTLIKANRQQLINLLELIKGFLAFEAQEIAERSDPTIQLPLQTARSDFHTLQSEVEVLNRNPGIQPNITLSHLNEISSNLAFLQREVRLIGTAGPIQGPIYQFTKPVEGFVSQRRSREPSGTQSTANRRGGSVPTNGASSTAANIGTANANAATTNANANAATTNANAANTNAANANANAANANAANANAANAANVNAANAANATASTASAALKAAAAAAAAANPDMYQRTANLNARSRELAEARRKATVRIASESNNGVSTSDLNADFEAQRAEAGMSRETRQPRQSRQTRQPLADLAAANEAAASVVPGRTAQSTPAMVQRDTPRHNRDSDDDNGGRATVQDLKSFINRLTAESMKISVSGTTAPLRKARETGIAKIQSDIEELITKIKEGRIEESEIPITKAQIENALRVSANPSEPLPQLLKATGLPPGFANLLPSNMQNDPETAREINHLIDKYMDTIVNGVSASFEVKYTSPLEAMKGLGAIMQSSTIDQTGFPSMSDLNNISNAQFTPYDSGYVTDPMAPTPMDAGRGPSRFDWKERSKQIEQQVRKRGLNPSDYGIMKPEERVSEGFSWKGYTRMMCTRLQADTDPSLPITCGCPPLDWSGWRIAK